MPANGVSFRIIDKNAEHSVHSKALAIWSGTLEHLAAAGLADRFFEAGLPIRKMMMVDTGHRVAEIHLSDSLESPYPTPIILPQSHTEELLLENLRGLGVEIERNLECTDLRLETNHVECDLKSPTALSRLSSRNGWPLVMAHGALCGIVWPSNSRV
jgi:2-polyprenyl-6-methoxyphenol hydroxylase-like FAD-dependent oxidoreductase